MLAAHPPFALAPPGLVFRVSRLKVNYFKCGFQGQGDAAVFFLSFLFLFLLFANVTRKRRTHPQSPPMLWYLSASTVSRFYLYLFNQLFHCASSLSHADATDRDWMGCFVVQLVWIFARANWLVISIDFWIKADVELIIFYEFSYFPQTPRKIEVA